MKIIYEILDAHHKNSKSPLILLFIGLALGWWVYVPFHELLHALGCIISGGEVTRLEISTIYGGGVLAQFFPFVVEGSKYSGQLTGFDTYGSDFTYMTTVLLPYLLTLWPGWFMLLSNKSYQSPIVAGFFFPWALAPLMAITGDMYEAGSIIATDILLFFGYIIHVERWRSDDLFLLWQELDTVGMTWLDIQVISLSTGFAFVLIILFISGGYKLSSHVRQSSGS